MDPFNQHTDEELWNALHEVRNAQDSEEYRCMIENVLTNKNTNIKKLKTKTTLDSYQSLIQIDKGTLVMCRKLSNLDPQ